MIAKEVIEEFLASHDLDFDSPTQNKFFITLPGEKKLETHLNENFSPTPVFPHTLVFLKYIFSDFPFSVLRFDPFPSVRCLETICVESM